MVFFVCEGCNETLKKNKVDAHAARCRNCWAVSCVDCSVVFKGNDYAAHTSCISEAQKHEGALYREKASNGKKKQSPQERWMEVVAEASCPSDAKFQQLLQRIAAYDNVPRKKAKFVNFMKNSIATTDAKTVERAFAFYETQLKANESESSANANETPAAQPEASAPEAIENGDSKKRNDRDEEKEEQKTAKKSKTSDKQDEKQIKWAKLIKSALQDAPSKQLELEALRSQLIASIQKKKLSSKSEKELKKEIKSAVRESDKVAVIEMVKLL